jgi:addiction module HigA family antidote
MKNPPHPGQHVAKDCLEPMGLSITKGAEILGVTRLTLSNLVNGKNGISPEMSIRLSKAFGGSPEVWLGMQMDYDLAQALKKGREHQGQGAASAGCSLAST